MKVVYFDTSQLSLMARDFRGSQERQDKLASFREEMADLGFAAAFTSHHVTELATHDRKDVVRSRFEFIASCNKLAIARNYVECQQLGSIVDLQASEVGNAVSNPSLEMLGVHEAVRSFAYYPGDGSDYFRYTSEDLDEVMTVAKLLFDKANLVAAVRYSPSFGNPNEKVVDVLNGTITSEADRKRIALAMTTSLRNYILSSGDERIGDAEAVARDFVAGVRNQPADLDRLGKAALCDALFDGWVGLNDVTPTMIMEEAWELCEFRGKLRTVVDSKMPRSWDIVLSRITPELLPTWVLQRDLYLFSQELERRRGSELEDCYHACYALYADVSYVDKRTLENLTRVRRSSAAAESLIAKVPIYKVTEDYDTILGHLRAAAHLPAKADAS
jgi:hypothetical protein